MTIRKKFVKGFVIPEDVVDEQIEQIVKKLETENDYLRNELQEYVNMKTEKDILEEKLKTAEKEILNYVDA